MARESTRLGWLSPEPVGSPGLVLACPWLACRASRVLMASWGLGSCGAASACILTALDLLASTTVSGVVLSWPTTGMPPGGLAAACGTACML